MTGKGSLGQVGDRGKERGTESWRNTDADKEMKTSREITGSHGRMMSKGRTRGFAEIVAKREAGGAWGGCPSPGRTALPV